MPTPTPPTTSTLLATKLEDFGQLQERYQAMKLAERAAAILRDAAPALAAAESILQSLAEHADARKAFDKLRKNSLLTGKMRASEARNMLLDAGDDFIAGARRKLAAWHKTMERISQGESIAGDKGSEYIPGSSPLGMAIIGSAGICHFLSVAQLALAELGRMGGADAARTPLAIAEMRRSATILSDCENAAGIHAAVR